MVEGFVDSWVLAAALVAATFGGAWRVMSRLVNAFADHQPLVIGPDKKHTA